MVIGIDASRAFISGRTGTENYSYHLVTEMLRLPESRSHTFVLFIRPNVIVPAELAGYSNVMVKVVRWKYLWTQVGLAWETWQMPVLDVLWVPAHTLPVLRKSKIKTVVTIHGLEYQWLPEYKNFLQRWYLPLSTMYAAKYSDKLIAVSKFTANQLKKELHTSSKKIKVIHEGVAQYKNKQRTKNMEYREKLYSIFNIRHSRYILFVGTIQPRKNLTALIKAMAMMDPDLGEYKLVIAGQMGWMAQEVFETAIQSGIAERIIFTGRVSQRELRQLYQGAALYVQPSLTEGFGLPILEAMAQGVPVVSSDGGALSEVVGRAGIIAKLGQDPRVFTTALSLAMARMLRDSTLRAKMIAAGQKRAEEFSWTKTAKETLKVLLET